MSNEKERINVIIPAAGMGRRMKSYGPKSLIKIGSSTIIKNQINLIKTYLPKCTITLVCGFQAKNVMSQTPNDILKVENENYQDTNVARSIGIGLRVLENSSKVIVIYGDLVFNSETIKSLSTKRSAIIVTNEAMGEGEVGCITDEGQLCNLMYDLPKKWGQISVFIGKELRLLKDLCWDDKNYRKFGFEIINQIIQQGGSFSCIEDDSIKIIDIDNSKDIEKAKNILL
tara:strand:- start:1782 stop:2468 length:687 start_codon:yes stop_codon:yes gene_type:complete